ncbi:AAA family ATPase [Cellulosimicrobium cellulans]|uniref:RNA polymerase recycling motor ATPase HelR n=1 Tax=Cellulosimicrobium cellulans TaxID=1710 RepID=UPI001EDB23C8|nr:RNA polymerase recycling motor ATPase HelR [Cellulosimicrobium cellulans]UKJ65003.1 AAA family ATPase [Cellulosimicrobium cellulans]
MTLPDAPVTAARTTDPSSHPSTHSTAGQDPRPAPFFDLPARLAAKAGPALVDPDERHFAAIAASLEHSVADLSQRLDAARRAPGGSGTEALERDQEVHRLSSRLRLLQRYGVDLCLGRMTFADGSAPVYVGRVGLTDPAGERLLVDWRSPAAEPYFAATPAQPLGLAARRRYRWARGRVTDYWDEELVPDGAGSSAALDDQSAFVASLGASRSPRMRDVLGTIQADQDAIVRAGSRGALVVDGGPGTGKTVVALHRAAYLLYADPQVGEGHGGVLVVGPSRPYLSYVADVLPGLGEEGVQACTLRDLLPEGATARAEADPEVARLKASAALVAAIEPAVRFSERTPTEGMEVETPWVDVWLSTADWTEAFESVDPGTPHNEARDDVWAALVEILVDKACGGAAEDGADVDADADAVRRALRGHRGLGAAFDRAWPLVEATDLVADLWSVPAYLRLCAPSLTPEEVRALQRADAQVWTTADLPLLDAARQRLGDPEASRRRRRNEAAAAAERARMDDVVDHLVASDDSELMVMTMLKGQDLRDALVDEGAMVTATPDRLAGPFAHVVVDEAQELTDAEWQMILSRCPSRSVTVVGDRAQARHGFAEGWSERLGRVGFDRVAEASLSVNYRTPQEVMAAAEPVIRAALPDANVPTSVRSTGVPVAYGSVADLDGVLDGWLAQHAEGTACVIGGAGFVAASTEPISARFGEDGASRVQVLTPETAKGLEFDLVVLVDPQGLGDGVEGAVDRYVAMTRATQRLVVLDR